MIDAVGVVVPAHDEEALLPACLAGLTEAAAVAMAERPSLRVRIVVAADACRDGTAAVARRAGALVVPLTARNVGVARAAGLHELLRSGSPAWGRGGRPSPDALWLGPPHAGFVGPPAGRGGPGRGGAG